MNQVRTRTHQGHNETCQLVSDRYESTVACRQNQVRHGRGLFFVDATETTEIYARCLRGAGQFARLTRLTKLGEGGEGGEDG